MSAMRIHMSVGHKFDNVISFTSKKYAQEPAVMN